MCHLLYDVSRYSTFNMFRHSWVIIKEFCKKEYDGSAESSQKCSYKMTRLIQGKIIKFMIKTQIRIFCANNTTAMCFYKIFPSAADERH